MSRELGMMGADQIAEIAPLVREVLEAPSDVDLCATFAVVGNEDAWAQVTTTEINVAYPSDAEPEQRLAAHFSDPPCVVVSEWEPRKFVS